SPPAPAGAKAAVELSFKNDPAVLDGRYANNGWQQELPKPITKLTWDNAILVSPATAKSLGIEPDAGNLGGGSGFRGGEHGQTIVPLVRLRVNDRVVTAPAFMLPG